MSDANRETIVVVRPAGRDRHGDPSGAASEHSIAGVLVAPSQPSEDVGTGDQTTSRWDLYPPVGADIRATDRVRRPAVDPAPADGADMRHRAPWVVVGDPSPWRSPWSDWAPGAVVRIERQSG